MILINIIKIYTLVFFFLFLTYEAEATLWTPADMLTAAWYDASDESTFTKDVAGVVSQWRTKTGTVHLNQSSAALRPIWGDQTINGLNTVKFDGFDDRMTLPIQLILSSGGSEFNPATEREAWVVIHADETEDEPILANTSTSQLTITGNQLQFDGGSLGSYPTNTLSSNIGATPSFLGFIPDSFKKYSINGFLETTTDARGSSTANRIIVNQVGFRAGTSAFTGVIGEIMFTRNISTDDVRRRIEGYLAHKWGLEDKLPNDHIYKNSAPTTSTYTLTFDSNGGSVVAPITTMHGSTVTPPSNPTREGYTFASWSPALPTTTPEIDSSHTAQWTINQYTLTFDSDGGSAVTPITGDYNSSFTTPTSPTKTDYSFAGWSPALPTTIPSSDVTYTAIWKPGLIFNSDGGSIVNMIIDDFDAVVTPPANPTKDGHTFLGWSPELPVTMPATNQTHTALWEEIQTRRKTSTSVATRIMNLQNMGNLAEAQRLREQYNLNQPNRPQSLTAAQIIDILIQLNIIKGDNVVKARQLIETLPATNTTPSNSNLDENPIKNPIPTFTQNLERGSTHPEVLKLQNFLTKKGYMTVTPNGHFGPATEAALIQFQKDNNISPAVGYFGPVTRRVVNQR